MRFVPFALLLVPLMALGLIWTALMIDRAALVITAIALAVAYSTICFAWRGGTYRITTRILSGLFAAAGLAWIGGGIIATAL